MSKIQLVKSDPLFMQEVDTPVVTLEKEDYLLRLNLLVERIKTCGYTHAVIYGDREHFSHIEYFTSYDCRFEEALFIVNAAGETAILVGNEGLAYSEQIPYPIRRILYQNFSLQGQPKDQLRPLSTCPSLESAGKAGLAWLGSNTLRAALKATRSTRLTCRPIFLTGCIGSAHRSRCSSLDRS